MWIVRWRLLLVAFVVGIAACQTAAPRVETTATVDLDDMCRAALLVIDHDHPWMLPAVIEDDEVVCIGQGMHQPTEADPICAPASVVRFAIRDFRAAGLVPSSGPATSDKHGAVRAKLGEESSRRPDGTSAGPMLESR